MMFPRWHTSHPTAHILPVLAAILVLYWACTSYFVETICRDCQDEYAEVTKILKDYTPSSPKFNISHPSIRIRDEYCDFSHDKPFLPASTASIQLKKTHAILHYINEVWYKKLGLPVILVKGTLLGARRHHGLIPRDGDADVGVLIPREYQQASPFGTDTVAWYNFLSKEKPKELEILGLSSTPNSKINYSFYFSSTDSEKSCLMKLDIIFFIIYLTLVFVMIVHARDKNILVFMCIICAFQLCWIAYSRFRTIHVSMGFEADMMMVCNDNCLLDLCKCKFGPLEMLCPVNTDEVLGYSYGENFMNPIDGFDAPPHFSRDRTGNYYCVNKHAPNFNWNCSSQTH